MSAPSSELLPEKPYSEQKIKIQNVHTEVPVLHIVFIMLLLWNL